MIVCDQAAVRLPVAAASARHAPLSPPHAGRVQPAAGGRRQGAQWSRAYSLLSSRRSRRDSRVQWQEQRPIPAGRRRASHSAGFGEMPARRRSPAPTGFSRKPSCRKASSTTSTVRSNPRSRMIRRSSPVMLSPRCPRADSMPELHMHVGIDAERPAEHQQRQNCGVGQQSRPGLWKPEHAQNNR